MGWDIARYTHPGRHEENQDAIAVWEADGRLSACVCDGLGGMGGGAQAAGFCVSALAEKMESMPGEPTTEWLEEQLAAVHRALIEEKRNVPALGRARSTAVVAVLYKGKLVWSNVGDSRLYLFRGMDLQAASEDDSAAYAEYRHGAMTYGDIRMADTRNVLTACLGDERDVDPHSGLAELKPGDGVLLCSDGFWQYVLEGEMGADLCKSKTAEAWLKLMLNRLAGRSQLDGDNLSAVCCRVADAPQREEEETLGD